MENVEFKAPGPGVWELEQTHFSRPATRLMSEVAPSNLSRGFAEGTRRYGLLLDTLKFGFVNDFAYTKFCPVGAPDGAAGPPPRALFTLLTWLHPEMRRRINSGAAVFDAKLWRQDLKRWDEEYKPDSIARNQRLQRAPIAELGDAAFARHLDEAITNAGEMVYRHHIFTVPCIFPVGHFLAEVQDWTGLPSGEVLGLLKGAAPISRGVAAAELDVLQSALAERGITADQYRGRPAREVLDSLRAIDGVGERLEAYLDVVSYRVVTGYDVADKYALEMPEMLVRAIFGAKDTGNREADFERRRQALREKVPAAHRSGFDELLEEARSIHRLRDERGLYNDSWGTGLARRAVLEAGRRLKAMGALPDAGLALSAGRDELLALLGGSGIPTAEELRRARPGARRGRSPTRRSTSVARQAPRPRWSGSRSAPVATRAPWTRLCASCSACPIARPPPGDRWRGCRCTPASTKAPLASSAGRRTSNGSYAATYS
jgi:rifampicin phosphotransferase